MTDQQARLAAAAVLSAAGCPLDNLDAAAKAMWREIEVARLVGRAELAKELADKVLREARQSEVDVRFAVLDRKPARRCEVADPAASIPGQPGTS